MNTTVISSVLARWPLPRVLILLLAGAFVGLMTDIRIEHVDAVHEHSVAWVPIIYCAFMTVASLIACVYWTALTRRVMIALFLLAFVVGGMGFYLHNHGKLKKVIANSMNAWIDPNMNHSDAPPQLAPLAFAGLGMIGILASLKQFNK
jgi:hypothetical protein